MWARWCVVLFAQCHDHFKNQKTVFSFGYIYTKFDWLIGELYKPIKLRGNATERKRVLVFEVRAVVVPLVY